MVDLASPLSRWCHLCYFWMKIKNGRFWNKKYSKCGRNVRASPIFAQSIGVNWWCLYQCLRKVLRYVLYDDVITKKERSIIYSTSTYTFTLQCSKISKSLSQKYYILFLGFTLLSKGEWQKFKNYTFLEILHCFSIFW